MSPDRSFKSVGVALLLAILSIPTATAGVLRLVVLEGDSSEPVACRVHMMDADQKPVRAANLPFWHDHFVCPGKVELGLQAGSYTYEIERGPEYFSLRGTVSLLEGEAKSVTNRLQPLTHLRREGWWSGELHVHRPIPDIQLLMQAEDLHIAEVITWWNKQNPWSTRSLPAQPLIRFDQDRFYHIMAGEDERNGGALLYFNLPGPLNITNSGSEFPSPVVFLEEARRYTNVWIDVEKPFWLDAPAWFASMKVDSVGIAHNHMHRGGVLDNEAWGKARDQEAFRGPHGNGHWTQHIYYHLLNCGLRLPPSAGSASGVLPNPVGYNRAYVHIDGPITYEKWFENLHAGRVFVSNGPLLRCRANGELPGHVFRGMQGRSLNLSLQAVLDSRDPATHLEIIKNGRIERTVPLSGLKENRGSLGNLLFEESGWFLVRVLADVPSSFRFASTGPFYVETGGSPQRISKTSAQFFLTWVRDRIAHLKVDDAQQRAEVLKPLRQAERFWEAKVFGANAD
jgi:hypothetical protein